MLTDMDTIWCWLAYPLTPCCIPDTKFVSGVRRSRWCVWHPTIGDHLPHRSLHFVSQTVRESIIVAIVMKDGPTSIAARHDVIDRTGELQRRRSGYRSGSFGEEKRTTPGHSAPSKTEPAPRRSPPFEQQQGEGHAAAKVRGSFPCRCLGAT